MSRRRRWYGFGIGVVCAIIGAGAFGLRVWGIHFSNGLPRGRPDEELFIVPALRMFGPSLDPGLLGYGFPEGYFFLLHAMLRFYAGWLTWYHGEEVNLGCVFAVNPTNLLLVGRVLSAALGTLTLIPTALMARHLVSRACKTRVTLVAVLLLAVNYLHGRDSHFAVTDASVTFFLTWAVWAVVRFAAKGRTADALLAGLLTGLAISVKWIALFMVPVLGLVLLHSLWHFRKENLGRCLLVTALCLFLLAVGFFALSPHVLITPGETYHGVLGHQMRYDPSEARRFLLDLTVDSGRGIRFHSLVTLPIALGRAGLAAAIFGLGFAFRRQASVAWTCLLVLLFLYGAAVGPIRLLFVRYCIPVLPVLVALASAGIVEGVEELSRWLDRPARRRAVFALLVAATAAEPAVRLVQADMLLSRTDTRELAARWILTNAPLGATVVPETAYTDIYAVEGKGVAACNAVLPPSLRGTVPNLPGERLNWAAEIARGREGWATIADNALNNYWNAGVTLDPDYLTQGAPILSCGKSAQIRGLQAPAPACWEKMASFSPGTPLCSAVYDLFDQFYVPYAGFAGVGHPGPQVTVYRNRCKRLPGAQ